MYKIGDVVMGIMKRLWEHKTFKPRCSCELCKWADDIERKRYEEDDKGSSLKEQGHNIMSSV
jgi:hypothetical protein